MHHGQVNKKIAKGLKELQRRIDKAKIPPSKLDDTILLATWNIRNFGSKGRMEASYHYIAEILGQFDLIAVTEVGANLKPLARVQEILGRYWRIVYSDFVPDRGGNQERIAYVYDERAVHFTGLAAEADPAREKNKSGEYASEITWWRSPYMASFRAGNFDFVLISAHIRWGKSAMDRLKPLRLLAQWVKARRDSPHAVDKDIIVLGDFNIPKIGDKYYKALTSGGLKLPLALAALKIKSNLKQTASYDQILHYPTNKNRFDKKKAGKLDFHKGGIAKLFPGKKMSEKAFTFQMSDHFPLWIEVNTYIDGDRLNQIINKGR